MFDTYHNTKLRTNSISNILDVDDEIQNTLNLVDYLEDRHGYYSNLFALTANAVESGESATGFLVWTAERLEEIEDKMLRLNDDLLAMQDELNDYGDVLE